MTSTPEQSYKVEKLRGHEDFAWKGDVRQILCSSDPQLLGLMPNIINNTPAAQGIGAKLKQKPRLWSFSTLELSQSALQRVHYWIVCWWTHCLQALAILAQWVYRDQCSNYSKRTQTNRMSYIPQQKELGLVYRQIQRPGSKIGKLWCKPHRQEQNGANQAIPPQIIRTYHHNTFHCWSTI